METYNASITRSQEVVKLVLALGDEQLEITLTEDKPSETKAVFNKLILHLKEKEFSFSLVGEEHNDLYHNVCSEYIKQLNEELKLIYNGIQDENS